MFVPNYCCTCAAGSIFYPVYSKGGLITASTYDTVCPHEYCLFSSLPMIHTWPVGIANDHSLCSVTVSSALPAQWCMTNACDLSASYYMSI